MKLMKIRQMINEADRERKYDFFKSRADKEFAIIMEAINRLLGNLGTQKSPDLEKIRKVRDILETTELIDYWNPK